MKISMTKEENKCTRSFSDLMRDIINYDKKLEKDTEDCMTVAPVVFWTQIFGKYFINSIDEYQDDMLFYVKIKNKIIEEVEVHRQFSSKAPGLGDPLVEWNETVFLNMILHQVKYVVTMAIYSIPSGSTNLVFHQRKSMEVFPSPSHRKMSSKGSSTELTYPNIFFTIDNFEEEWDDMQLNEDQKVSVEMHAEEKQKSDVKYSLFSGALDYHTLYNEYKSKSSGKMSTMASKWTLGLVKLPPSKEFFKIPGPNKKGYVELAVQKIYPERSVTTKTCSMKTHLTYLTLPWQDIVLSLMKGYEKQFCPQNPS